MFPDRLQVACIVSLPFEENTYVVRMKDRDDCIVVDPGLEPEKIIEHLDSENITPAAILLTHGHADHIGGNAALKARWPDCPLVIGAADAPKLTDPNLNLSGPFGVPLISPPADLLVREGDEYQAAGLSFQVAEIPGHSIGHVVFVSRQGQPTIVLGGDVLFAGSVGRTDFPDGSFEQLEHGIHQKLFSLPDDTLVLPGHGPVTTIGREKRTNPYVGASAR